MTEIWGQENKQNIIFAVQSVSLPLASLELSSILSMALMVEPEVGVSIIPDIRSPLMDNFAIEKISLKKQLTSTINRITLSKALHQEKVNRTSTSSDAQKL
jgi:hypothetical protein